MIHYRFYVLDQKGAIQRGCSLELADDNAAFAKALALADEGAIEVWEGTRKVCWIDSNAERRTG